MIKFMNVKNKLSNVSAYPAIIKLLFAFFLAVIICLCLYLYDNKYTASGPQAADGVLSLTESDLQKYPVLMLVNGWEYYPSQLLTPEDLSQTEQPASESPSKDIDDKEIIFIGQYGGFESGNSNNSPHGSATYRLTVELPGEPKTYTLELPEIFSSYRAYINGELAASMGNPDPEYYVPETLSQTVSFTASGSVEILIAVSDYSHLYSGLVYPPSFGEPMAVNKLLAMRFLFRSIVCSVALIIGLLSIFIGILNRRRHTTLLYGILCLLFIGYICYPIVKTFISSYSPFYALENFSFCAMLVVVMLLGRTICQEKRRWTLVFPAIGGFACISSLILHLSLSGGNLAMMYSYSFLINGCEWITAVSLTVMTVYAVLHRNIAVQSLLIGITVFDTALVMDRLLPLYEPVITGWFPELASFVLVLSIGVFIARETANQYLLGAILEEKNANMERLLQMQRTYYPLIQEKISEAKIARHDLRHHLVMLSGFLADESYEKLRRYLIEYQKESEALEQLSYCQNEVADILAHYYMRLSKERHIVIEFTLDIVSSAGISDNDLCTLMSNLLENAVEACCRIPEEERFITFSTVSRAGVLSLYMENSCGSRQNRSIRTGFGLDSVRMVADRYNGTAAFNYDEINSVFTSDVVLTIDQ